MSRGPLRRATASLGLLALVPLGLLLATGALAPVDAAVRGVITVVGVVVLGRLADRGLQGLIAVVERGADTPATSEPDEADR